MVEIQLTEDKMRLNANVLNLNRSMSTHKIIFIVNKNRKDRQINNLLYIKKYSYNKQGHDIFSFTFYRAFVCFYFSPASTEYWHSKFTWIPTLLNDRKCLIETSNVVSCNKGVGSKLCLIYSLYKNMWCVLNSIWTHVWFYYFIYRVGIICSISGSYFVYFLCTFSKFGRGVCFRIKIIPI
jgi:hypothetical protein